MPVTIVDKILEFFLGSRHEREMKRLAPRVASINAFEATLTALSDDELRNRLLAIRDQVRNATAELPEDAIERRRHVQAVLDASGWNITKAARILDVDRVTLYNKIRKYDLKKPDSGG